jgi:hypothetical protein
MSILFFLSTLAILRFSTPKSRFCSFSASTSSSCDVFPPPFSNIVSHASLTESAINPADLSSMRHSTPGVGAYLERPDSMIHFMSLSDFFLFPFRPGNAVNLSMVGTAVAPFCPMCLISYSSIDLPSAHRASMIFLQSQSGSLLFLLLFSTSSASEISASIASRYAAIRAATSAAVPGSRNSGFWSLPLSSLLAVSSADRTYLLTSSGTWDDDSGQ